jgi:hypothetical protein
MQGTSEKRGIISERKAAMQLSSTLEAMHQQGQSNFPLDLWQMIKESY